jgi:hypothetical protein
MVQSQCLVKCGSNMVRASSTNTCECKTGFESISGACVAACASDQVRSDKGVCESKDSMSFIWIVSIVIACISVVVSIVIYILRKRNVSRVIPR